MRKNTPKNAIAKTSNENAKNSTEKNPAEGLNDFGFRVPGLPMPGKTVWRVTK